MAVNGFNVGDRVALVSEFGAYWPPLPAGHEGVIAEIHAEWDCPLAVKLDGAGTWLFEAEELTQIGGTDADRRL